MPHSYHRNRTNKVRFGPRWWAAAALGLMTGIAVAAPNSSFLTATGNVLEPPSSAPAKSDAAKPQSAEQKPAAKAEAAPAKPAAAKHAAAANPENPRATYLISDRYLHGNPEILWAGFLTGLRGFEHFYDPVGNPLYFESPFNTTQIRFLYLHHDFPDGSQLGGGDVNVYAAQIRLALTERLAFIATKDGWSDLNARILPNAGGWNDFAIGLKYLFIVDRAADFVLAGGLRWTWDNGDKDVHNGNTQELSPFVSFAKGFDRFHLLGDVSGRIPTDSDLGNCIVQWDLHADYEIAPEALPGLAPMVELHGLHYLSDGSRLPLAVGGMDYANIGSDNVAGDGVISLGLGARWKFSPHMSLGSAFEFALHNNNNDIMGNRLTVDLALNW